MSLKKKKKKPDRSPAGLCGASVGFVCFCRERVDLSLLYIVLILNIQRTAVNSTAELWSQQSSIFLAMRSTVRAAKCTNAAETQLYTEEEKNMLDVD